MVRFHPDALGFAFLSWYYTYEGPPGLPFAVVFKNNKELARAFNIFGEISAWVVVPIVAALIIGKYLDGRYDTKPWIFLGATAIAFVISISGIAKILNKYIKEINTEIKNKNGGSN